MSISLYELIKQASQKLERPLKVIADWDDCLQPVKPVVIYDGAPNLNISLEEFFKEFWENSVITVSSVEGSIIEEFRGRPEVKAAIDEWMRKKKEGRKNPQNYNFRMKDYNFYERSPLLFTAECLLQCLKEDLISELIVISAYRKGENTEFMNESARQVVEEKTGKIKKTFGQFPCVKIEMTGQKRIDGKHRPFRSETIRDKYSDFDVYLDDSQTEIKRTREIFPNKVYVLPDYLCTRKTQGSNIHHVKTAISDIKDEDFVKAAEEYKAKKEQELATRQAKPNQTSSQERERERIFESNQFFIEA